jgi:hypothetical protein
LNKCTFQWNEEIVREVDEMYRDDSFYSYKIMTTEQFNNLKFMFKAKINPFTKRPINLCFTKESFEETEAPLFQMAAHEKLQRKE